ncbi:hypothetical protein [Actinopolymorpha cephalotaxi]|uniref:hypothetical protein n=1 Tax=Actinopolymorpha cephalotaxi TaxID=504797 RepID=UPI001EE283CD|nr:hypothetical protein [Actinopolymorpha cephalotaxi]
MPANGKTEVVRVFDGLGRRHRQGVLFIVDCDNEIEDRLKGHSEFVISANMDIDADLVFELSALDRVATECLADRLLDGDELRVATSELLIGATELSIGVTVVQQAARRRRLPTKVVSDMGGRREFRVRDLSDELLDEIGSGDSFVRKLAADMANLIEWSDRELRLITAEAVDMYGKPCGPHGIDHCIECHRRSSCRGHTLVQAISVVLKKRHNVSIGVPVLESLLRTGADRRRLEGWEVARRIRRWEDVSGYKVLAAE